MSTGDGKDKDASRKGKPSLVSNAFNSSLAMTIYQKSQQSCSVCSQAPILTQLLDPSCQTSFFQMRTGLRATCDGLCDGL